MDSSKSESQKLSTIRVGATIAYLMILVLIIFVLQNNFCSYDSVQKISMLLTAVPLSVIIPWLYINMALHENDKKSKKIQIVTSNLDNVTENLKDVYEKFATSSEVVNSQQLDKNLKELKIQIDNLYNFAYQSTLCGKAFEKLGKKRVQEELARKAEKNILSTEILNEYVVDIKKRRGFKNNFRQGLFQCMRWLSYSLEGCVAPKVDKLKSKYILEKVQIYEMALLYIRNEEIDKKFPNDSEVVKKVQYYIDILIERIKN